MNNREKFQQHLQNPKWCEKQVRRLLTRGTKKYFVILLSCIFIIHLCLPAIYLIGQPENSDTTAEAQFFSPVFFVLISLVFIYAVLLYLFFHIVFLKHCKHWKQMDIWGDRQETHRSICMEFYDKSHPPIKTAQVWTTPHYIILAPNILPKLYYLPLLTKRAWTPKEEDVLYFSDGKKIGLTHLSTESRILIEEAIKDFLPENDEAD